MRQQFQRLTPAPLVKLVIQFKRFIYSPVTVKRERMQLAADNLALTMAHAAQRVKRYREVSPVFPREGDHLLLKLHNQAPARNTITRLRCQQDVLLIAGGDGKDRWFGPCLLCGKPAIYISAPGFPLPAYRRRRRDDPRGLPVGAAIRQIPGTRGAEPIGRWAPRQGVIVEGIRDRLCYRLRWFPSRARCIAQPARGVATLVPGVGRG